MARYNEIQVGRYNRALQKLLSMKGAASLESLQPELVPVLNTFYGAENRYLEQWDRFTAAANVAGVAGNQTAWRLRNPTNSNVVAVIEKIMVIATSATARGQLSGNQVVGLNSDLTNAIPVFGVDLRGRSNSTLSFSQEALAGTTTLSRDMAEIQSAINGSMYDFIVNENQEIPMLPGAIIQFNFVTVNISGMCTMWWRERFLEESERL